MAAPWHVIPTSFVLVLQLPSASFYRPSFVRRMSEFPRLDVAPIYLAPRLYLPLSPHLLNYLLGMLLYLQVTHVTYIA